MYLVILFICIYLVSFYSLLFLYTSVVERVSDGSLNWRSFSPVRLIGLGLTVISVFTVSLGPFVLLVLYNVHRLTRALRVAGTIQCSPSHSGPLCCWYYTMLYPDSYCEIIFICWTFNFVYFMGRKIHKFKIPTQYCSHYCSSNI